jgi:hypothetical protein
MHHAITLCAAKSFSQHKRWAAIAGGRQMQFVPCILCGSNLEKRISKNRKPYFVCDPCGIQLFVRRKAGIERLEEFFRNARKAEIPFKQHAQNFYRMQAILKEISDVKTEMKKTESFWPSDDQRRTRNLLKTRVDNLFFQLADFAKTKS